MKKTYTCVALFWLAFFACWCSYCANDTLPVRLVPVRTGGLMMSLIFIFVAGVMLLGYLAGKEHDDKP